MKVIQVNTVYPGGSTGKIINEIHHKLIKTGNESMVVYGRGATTENQEAIRLCSNRYAQMNSLLSRCTGMRYGGCHYSTKKLCRLITRENPDLVHLHSINDHFLNLYQFITWLKQQQIPTVITLHAEFFYTGNCSHAMECEKWKHGCGQCPRIKEATKAFFWDRTASSWKRMKGAFQGFEDKCILIAVSPWVETRVHEAPIMQDMPIQTILNGVNSEVFRYRNMKQMRMQYMGERRHLVLHVTAYFSDQKMNTKGGWHVLQLAKRMPDVMFLIAGTYKKNIVVPDNVVLLGNMKEQARLAELYACADVTLVTGKRETFSMPCAESLCCGTPVVGYQAGAPETIAMASGSEFVEQGNLTLLEGCVRKWLLKKNIDKSNLAQKAQLRYSGDRMTQEYLAIYQKIIRS